MATKLLTDVELRAHWSARRDKYYVVEPGTILTPSARDFLHEHGIELKYQSGASVAGSQIKTFAPPSPGIKIAALEGTHIGENKPAGGSMSRTPIPVKEGKACFVNAYTGEELHEKPEEMTHLRGNLLVNKTHPQIAFRGKLDSLMARVMCVEVIAYNAHKENILKDLEELLGYIQKILGAEVKDEPLPAINLLGMDSAGIRHASHFVKDVFGMDHPIPNYHMGQLCMALNELRTQIRETELAAALAFTAEDGKCTRTDIVEGLNRLSSCTYIMFCRELSGYYDRGK